MRIRIMETLNNGTFIKFYYYNYLGEVTRGRAYYNKGKWKLYMDDVDLIYSNQLDERSVYNIISSYTYSEFIEIANKTFKFTIPNIDNIEQFKEC